MSMRPGMIRRCTACDYKCLIRLQTPDRRYDDMWICKILSNIGRNGCAVDEADMETLDNLSVEELIAI